MSQNITDVIKRWVRFKKNLSSNVRQNIGVNSICKVETGNGELGLGFLCTISILGREIPLLITSHELLPTSCIEEVTETIFHFSSFKLLLKTEFVNNCWTSLRLNATVIELSFQGEKYLKTLKATFLECAESLEVEEKIKIYTDIGGFNELSNKPNSIIKSQHKDLFNYQLYSNKAVCGGPIINSKGFVIGIPKKDTKDDLQKATLLSKIILSFLEDRYRPFMY